MTDSGYECKTFLIPKSCNCCAISSPVCWKKSMCLSEIHTIANEMKDKHRKCYRLIKLLLELVDDTVYYRSYFNQYSVKTVVLHHSRQCLDTSDECANCVLHIFRELQLAHETRRLRSLHSNQMLNGQWILGRILQTKNCSGVLID